MHCLSYKSIRPLSTLPRASRALIHRILVIALFANSWLDDSSSCTPHSAHYPVKMVSMLAGAIILLFFLLQRSVCTVVIQIIFTR
jgi:hypothetical protein